MKDKRKKQRLHARRRFLERYGLVVNEHDLDAMRKQIEEGKGIFLFKQSNRVTHWKINFGGQEFTVAYDKMRKTIVTVFPDDEILENT